MDVVEDAWCSWVGCWGETVGISLMVEKMGCGTRWSTDGNEKGRVWMKKIRRKKLCAEHRCCQGL